MPIDPIKIPQNVYIEDRIVGPLTLKQIITVGIGCGFSYALWSTISNAYGSIGIAPTILIWIPGALSAVFAFIKINDLSMLKICFLMVEQMGKSPQRAWSPRRGITINLRTFSKPPDAKKQHEAIEAAMLQKKAQRIDTLTDALDEPMAPGEDEPSLGEYGDAVTEKASRQSSGVPNPPGDAAEQPPTESRFASILPVTKDRVTASPAEGPNLDGVSQRAKSSIFTDIAAPKS